MPRPRLRAAAIACAVVGFVLGGGDWPDWSRMWNHDVLTLVPHLVAALLLAPFGAFVVSRDKTRSLVAIVALSLTMIIAPVRFDDFPAEWLLLATAPFATAVAARHVGSARRASLVGRAAQRTVVIVGAGAVATIVFVRAWWPHSPAGRHSDAWIGLVAAWVAWACVGFDVYARQQLVRANDARGSSRAPDVGVEVDESEDTDAASYRAFLPSEVRGDVARGLAIFSRRLTWAIPVAAFTTLFAGWSWHARAAPVAPSATHCEHSARLDTFCAESVVALSPAGRYLATLSGVGVSLWDTTTGTRLWQRTLEVDRRYRYIQFTNKGDRVVVFGEGVSTLAVETGDEHAIESAVVTPGNRHGWTSLATRRDRLAGLDDSGVVMLDLDDEHVTPRVPKCEQPGGTPLLRDDGEEVFVMCGDELTRWSVASGERLAKDALLNEPWGSAATPSWLGKATWSIDGARLHSVFRRDDDAFAITRDAVTLGEQRVQRLYTGKFGGLSRDDVVLLQNGDAVIGDATGSVAVVGRSTTPPEKWNWPRGSVRSLARARDTRMVAIALLRDGAHRIELFTPP